MVQSLWNRDVYPRSVIVALLSCLLLLFATPAGATPSPLPPNEGERLLSLSAPSISPGTSGSLTVLVSNPFNVTLSALSLSIQLYRWDEVGGSGGNLSATDGWAPSLSIGGGAPGLGILWSTSGLLADQSKVLQVNVNVLSGTPPATYFIKDAMNVTTSSGSHYTLLSRGYFTDALWARATLPAKDGAPTLNLTLLNVSGVLPESSIVVESTAQVPWIWAILGIALGLGAFGGYLWARKPKGQRSSEGANPSLSRSRAERAFGKRRKRDGD